MTLETKHIVVENLRFFISVTQDNLGLPWDWCEGHGPVRPAHTGPKHPHERMLSKYWYYDWKAALEKAATEGWGAEDMPEGLTKRQAAEYVVQKDFDYLKAWANDDWTYSFVTVQCLEDKDYEDSVGGVEYWFYKDNPYMLEMATDIARSLAKQYASEQAEKAYWECRDVVTVCI